MEISRSLIAFAFIAEKYKETQDITQGLMPIFAPIVAENAGQEFIPSEFAKSVMEAYGIRMHPHVAESFAPKMEAAGLIESRPVSEGLVSYTNIAATTELVSLDEDEITSVDGLVDLLERHQGDWTVKIRRDGQILTSTIRQ